MTTPTQGFGSVADAVRLIGDWTANYDSPPTDAQIRRAAHALVRHVGGYNVPIADETLDAFDLDHALED